MGTKKKKKEIVLHLHSFIVVVIMSSSPSTTTTHTTTTKVFASSSPVVKTVLFGVLASTVIASFAVFASENAHILVQQTVSKDALVQGENVTVSVKNVKVLTPMQNNVGKALRVTGFFSLGALNTVEDWLQFSKWIAGMIALLLVNGVALKIKYGVQSLRRMAAVRGLE